MEFSAEQIKAYKAKFPDGIYLIEVGDKSCLLHEPTRQDYSYILACKDEVKMNELMVKQLWVDGDKEIQTDFKLTIAASKVAAETIFTVAEAKIKKL